MWRFPKVALDNGGGAFIIPWIVVIIIQGIPLVLVELLVGQRFRGGPMHSYGRMNKFCWGIGASMGFCSLYISLFYNSLLSYAFVYFFNSFTKDLPWLGCSGDSANNTDCIKNPAEYYYTYSVVNPAPDLESGSGVVWPLFFATAIAWGVVYLSMFVGVQSVGKVGLKSFSTEFPNSRNPKQPKKKNWSRTAEYLIMVQSDWLKFEI